MIGTQLAHYEILALLGEGGMGQVYRARDTKLDREVALKLLPQDLSGDPERLARFRREARVLASLNHPNIATIHGLEEDQGHLFLIMELAEGLDLTQRIAQGPMPVDDVVGVARQIAQGLEQAHERGVVHRDLKPANVKLGSDGTVKILDFGLARAYLGESPTEGDIATSPTITAAMTQVGTILGTAAYMSPEQARGVEVDRRADIWAFGVILYELLTGQRLFEGETVSDTLAEVIKTEPDFDALPEATPPALRWLIERCLRKRPSQRLRDIGEARVLLESDLGTAPASTTLGHGVVITERPRWVVPALVVVTIVAAALGFVGARSTAPPPPPAPAIQATLPSPEGQRLATEWGGHFEMSPDGTRVAFVATDSTGIRRLWVRRLDSPQAYVLSGTEDATYPFWSPDSERIGFFAQGRLRKIDAAGGVATTVCDAPNGRGGSWTADGRILLAYEVRDHLQIVPHTGGTPRAVTTVDSMHWSHRFPFVLPDDEHFVYMRQGEDDQLRWRSIDDGSDEKILLHGVHRGTYADGHLFFGRDGAMWARPFDPARGEFTGEEMLVADAVVTSSNFSRAAFSTSTIGSFVFLPGREATRASVATIDSTGRRIDSFSVEDGFMQDIALSRDGRYLAYSLFPTANDSRADLWIRDLQRGTTRRFTTNENADDPAWSPDGDRIAYSREGTLCIRSTTGRREVLLEADVGPDAIPHDWSNDGRYLIVSIAEGARSLLLVPVDDPDAAVKLVDNGTFNVHAVFSPDSRWVAYMSIESGDPRVYLRDIDPAGDTFTVSPDFGVMPRFREDGQVLYYVDTRGLIAVPVDFTDRGPEFGKPRLQFPIAVFSGQPNTHRYDLEADGARFTFLVDPSTANERDADLQLVTDWRRAIERP